MTSFWLIQDDNIFQVQSDRIDQIQNDNPAITKSTPSAMYYPHEQLNAQEFLTL